MTTGRRSGQPLMALGIVLGAWIALRVALFEPLPDHGSSKWITGSVQAGDGGLAKPHSSLPAPYIESEGRLIVREPAVRPTEGWPGVSPFQPMAPMPVVEPYRGPQIVVDSPRPTIPPRTAAAHSLLWMAGMGAVPLAPEVAAALESPLMRPTRDPGAVKSLRWGADAWLMWRDGASGVLAAGLSAPVYGGSQAGAVVRYRLAPRASSRPEIYVRAVTSLGAQGDAQIATGLAVRPLASVPITMHGEVRADVGAWATGIRPTAFLTTGVDDAALPGGLSARGYAQAGIVGGRNGTAFADGSFHVERTLIERRDSRLSVGAGIWGGAQRDAARVDIGPSASLKFRLGEGTGRLSADYRLRLAGNAEPRRGAALTLSASF